MNKIHLKNKYRYFTNIDQRTEPLSVHETLIPTQPLTPHSQQYTP